MTKDAKVAEKLAEELAQDIMANPNGTTVLAREGFDGPGWFAIEGPDGEIYYVQVTTKRPQS